MARRKTGARGGVKAGDGFWGSFKAQGREFQAARRSLAPPVFEQEAGCGEGISAEERRLAMRRESQHVSRMKTFWGSLLTFAVAGWAHAAPLYEQTFTRVEGEAVPDGIMVLDGQFVVKGTGPDRCLELPGAPLESFGVLFGSAAKDGREVEARILGTKTGRKFPTFAAGLNGVNGYKIRVSPAKNAVELVVGDALEVKATAPFVWKSGEWTHLKMRLVAAGSGVQVQGKAWQGGEEPKDWTLKFDATELPPPGMAGVWGMPYSGTPIRFDDLKVNEVK